MTISLFNPIRNLLDESDEKSASNLDARLHFQGHYVEVYDPLLGLGLMDDTQLCMVCMEDNWVQTHDGGWAEVDVLFVEKLQALAEERKARMIRRLALCDWGGDGMDYPSFDDSDAILEFSSLAKRFPALETLYIGDDPANQDAPEAFIGNINPILRKFPQLQHLHVRGNWVWLSKVQHTNLRSLKIEGIESTEDLADQVCMSNFPMLDRLDLWLSDFEEFGDCFGNEDAYGDHEGFEAMMTGKLFPRLRHLGLLNGYTNATFIQALVASPLYANLRSLDLSGGCLTDEGAALLAQSAAWSKLEVLNVSLNYITQNMLSLLAEGPWELRCHEQRTGNNMSPYHRWGNNTGLM